MIMPLHSTLEDEVRSHLKNKTKCNTFGLSTGRNGNEDAKCSVKCLMHIISIIETIILIL
uniref:Uncharacterized protein n=1 Tax=Nomascus leucogenys TaxID=61853 RepID=A0A2I3GAC3_NOMLE